MASLPKVKDIQVLSAESSESQIKCNNCEKAFASKDDLEFHRSFTIVEEIKQENTEVFFCKTCGKEFTSFRGMRQHIGKVHCVNKKTKCKFCNKRFKDNYAVKYHKKQVHDKSTQVECYLCGKILYNRFNLKKHLLGCRKKFFEGRAKDMIEREEVEA